MFIQISNMLKTKNGRMHKTKSNFPQVPFGKINLSRIFLTLLSFFSHIHTTRYSSLVHFSLSEGLYSKIFIDASPLLQICSIIGVWQFHPSHPTSKKYLPSLSIPMPQNYLRLTSSLRGTSLLWFSSVPSNHCLQSNLTLKLECIKPSCWKLFCGFNIQD